MRGCLGDSANSVAAAQGISMSWCKWYPLIAEIMNSSNTLLICQVLKINFIIKL